MLVADPSSTCDICYENFSVNRDCYSIPCGHVFCYGCLERLTQTTCPMCRTSLGSMRRIRKVHVDLSKCPDGETHRVRRLYKLEGKIVAETLEGRILTEQRATELSKKISEVLKKQPPSEHILLRSIGALLDQLSASMALLYEQSSLTRAVKASYEERVAQLERQLKERARRLKLLTRTESAALDEPAKIITHLSHPNQSTQEKSKKYRH